MSSGKRVHLSTQWPSCVTIVTFNVWDRAGLWNNNFKFMHIERDATYLSMVFIELEGIVQHLYGTAHDLIIC